jgi:heat shock protein HslJ
MLVLFALVAAACGAGSSQTGYGDAPSIEGAWQLESGTLDGAAVPIVDTHPITLTVEGDEVFGTAACNGYGGKVDVSGDSFSVGPLGVNEMACFPPETMESEQIFLDALVEVDVVEVAEGRLILRGETVELVFTALAPVPEAELTNTVWVLEGIVQGEAVASVAGERATLELFTDGSFIGSTGCRTLAGTYQISGAVVQFTSWGASGDCPPELAEQDSRVISALEGGFRVEIDGDVLTTWVAGDEGLIYRAEG